VKEEAGAGSTGSGLLLVPSQGSLVRAILAGFDSYGGQRLAVKHRYQEGELPGGSGGLQQLGLCQTHFPGWLPHPSVTSRPYKP